MPQQLALIRGVPDIDSDVPPGRFLARRRRAQEYTEHIAGLYEIILIIEEALEHTLDIVPLGRWAPGKMRCNDWQACDHPGCIAVREIHATARQAIADVARRREVTDRRVKRMRRRRADGAPK